MGVFTVVLLFFVMFAVAGSPFSRGQDVYAFKWAEKFKNARLALKDPLASQKPLSPQPPDYVMIAVTEVPLISKPRLDAPIQPRAFSTPLHQHQIETIPAALFIPMLSTAEAAPIEAPMQIQMPTQLQLREMMPAASELPVFVQPVSPVVEIDDDLLRRLDNLERIPETPTLVSSTHVPKRSRVIVRKSTRAVSVGRMIHNAIQADKSLSEAVKLTIRVTSTRGIVTLRGLVINDRSIAYVETKARKIAGWSAKIDNRLIAMA